MLNALIVSMALLQAPITSPVTFGFELESTYEYLAYMVETPQGLVPCVQTHTVGNETRCTANIVRPNNVKIRADYPWCFTFPAFPHACTTLTSNTISVPGGGGGGPPPGTFTVTFAKALPAPPVGIQTMAKEFVPTAYYTYADNNVLDLGTAGSIALWLKFTDTSTFAIIVIKDGNYIIEQSGSNVNVIRKRSAGHPSGAGQGWGWSVAIPSTGVWHQITLIVSGDEATDLYLNNVTQGGAGFFGGGTEVLTNPLHVGANGGSQAWNGAIAEFALYATALSAGNVTSLQTTAPSGVGSPQAYISFDASVDEQIASITPTTTGTINTVTGPTLGGGGGGGAMALKSYVYQRRRKS
jgi:concanavalin A-like lectin/glucanase superfamily protein